MSPDRKLKRALVLAVMFAVATIALTIFGAACWLARDGTSASVVASTGEQAILRFWGGFWPAFAAWLVLVAVPVNWRMRPWRG